MTECPKSQMAGYTKMPQTDGLVYVSRQSVCYVPQQTSRSAGKTNGSAVCFPSHNLRKVNFPSCPGQQHPYCHCNSFGYNTVFCLNLPFHVTTAHSCCCLLAPSVLAVVLQALSLGTSVDVARNNHTLLPALVTTCSHTLLLPSTN